MVFSLILVILHVFSLRAIIKANTEEAIAENVKKIEDISFSDGISEGFSFSLLFPVLIVIVLSFVEIGYFAFTVFILRDYVLITVASILIGYNLYALIKFFPKLRLFFKSPAEYFKEKADSFDNVLSYVMAVLEIIFCVYVIVKIFIGYNFF
ncbi:hypothetical protein LLG07_02100 [bacterium]|nr:hypothetical protein [bacterium]